MRWHARAVGLLRRRGSGPGNFRQPSLEFPEFPEELEAAPEQPAGDSSTPSVDHTTRPIRQPIARRPALAGPRQLVEHAVQATAAVQREHLGATTAPVEPPEPPALKSEWPLSVHGPTTTQMKPADPLPRTPGLPAREAAFAA